MTDTTQLYEFTCNDKVMYGTHIATNSEGLWVMDIKGSQPVAVPKESCVEVIPHSIRVSVIPAGTKIQVLAEKGKFKVGDVLICTKYGFVMVVEIDTKQKTSKELGVWRNW